MLNSKSAIRNSKSLVVTLLYMFLLFILSSIPGSGENGGLFGLSPRVANILHVPAYGLLALLWVFTLRDHGLTRQRSMWVAFLVASVYGALTELHQVWVPGRFPSVLDVMFNVAGSLLFIWLYWQVSMGFRISKFGLRICRNNFVVCNSQSLGSDLKIRRPKSKT